MADSVPEVSGPETLDLCIPNAGKWLSGKKLTSILRNAGVPFTQLTKRAKQLFAFVSFANLEDKARGQELINAVEIKGKRLHCTEAAKSSDSGRSKRKRTPGPDKPRKQGPASKSNEALEDDLDVPAADAEDVVTPWHDKPYAEQLALKAEAMHMVMVKLVRKIRRKDMKLMIDMKKLRSLNPGTCEDPVAIREDRLRVNKLAWDMCRRWLTDGVALEDGENDNESEKAADAESANAESQDETASSKPHVPVAPRIACPVADIVPSPCQLGYRNKISFTCGFNDEDKPMVGFRVGQFKNNNIFVKSPQNCDNIPEVSKAVANQMTEFIAASPLPAFNLADNSGVWRSVQLRITGMADRTEIGGHTAEAVAAALASDAAATPLPHPAGVHIMILVTASKANAEEEEVWEKELTRLSDMFKAGVLAPAVTSATRCHPLQPLMPACQYSIESFCLQLHERSGTGPADGDLTTVWGPPTIPETLLGFKFNISPTAFFQVNTAAAERLYQLIVDMAAPSPDTVLLDVCCGTGSIGICASTNAGRVIGVELNAEAVADALENARLNGVEDKTEWHASRAETVMKSLLSKATEVGQELAASGGGGGGDATARRARVIAIVDPPRTGLHPDVIKALRTCSAIDQLVYVSCNPTGSFLNDATSLCQIPTKNKGVKGPAFKPVRAVPVDLFPGTEHCELVTLFDRDPEMMAEFQ